MTQTVRKPSKTLGDEPQITNADELGLAMHELCWLTSEADAAHAKCNAEIARLKADAEKSMKTRGVSFRDRITAISAAVIAFASSARDTLLTGKGKTAKLTHGEIKFIEQKARIEVANSTLLQATVETLESALTRSLARQLAGEAKATALFDVKVTLNKTRGYDSFRTGDVSPDTLKQLGLTIEKPDEKVAVKPFSYTVETASDAA